jgi:7-carboxy-7-deazaguanine synthase (Cx14CxxC type)
LSYQVKEIFYSLQGEGFHAGRPAIFCRFAGCNLWSGKEADRKKALCQFCDTDFAGTEGHNGGRFANAEDLAGSVARLWPAGQGKSVRPFVICTGGEPLLQLDEKLISALHHAGFMVAVETNGTILPPGGIDWICVSPKANAKLLVRSGHELKLVFPQEGSNPEDFANLNFQNFFLQPQDGHDLEKNTKLTVDYVLAHPQWRLSLQMHKILGIQ